MRPICHGAVHYDASTGHNHSTFLFLAHSAHYRSANKYAPTRHSTKFSTKFALRQFICLRRQDAITQDAFQHPAPLPMAHDSSCRQIVEKFTSIHPHFWYVITSVCNAPRRSQFTVSAITTQQSVRHSQFNMSTMTTPQSKLIPDRTGTLDPIQNSHSGNHFAIICPRAKPIHWVNNDGTIQRCS